MQIWAWKSHSYASSKSIGVAFGRNCGCRETFEFRWNSRSSGRHWCTKRCNGWYLQRSRLHFSARNLFSSKVPCQYLPLWQKYLSHKICFRIFHKYLFLAKTIYCLNLKKSENCAPSLPLDLNFCFEAKTFVISPLCKIAPPLADEWPWMLLCQDLNSSDFLTCL